MPSASPRSLGQRRPVPGTHRHRRLVWRLAAGRSVAETARAEDCPPAVVACLLDDPATQILLDAWAIRSSLNQTARCAELLELAWIVMRRALLQGDLRVALFVAREEVRGRDPCLTLARSLDARRRRLVAATVQAAATSVGGPDPSPAYRNPGHPGPDLTAVAGAPDPSDPLRAVISAATRCLRNDLAAEHDAQTVAGLGPTGSDHRPDQPAPAVDTAADTPAAPADLTDADACSATPRPPTVRAASPIPLPSTLVSTTPAGHARSRCAPQHSRLRAPAIRAGP